MPANVIEKLLVNIEANAAQLQAELAKGGQSVQAFGKKTDAIAKGADGIGQRYTAAAVQISSAAENMARAGKLGGDGLKQIIVQGSNMAFLFGPQGAILGAVGIASLAILEIFRKTRDEVAKTAAETKQAIADLQNAGDVAGLTERARVLFQGTPAKGFTDGIKSLRAELSKLGGEIEASPLARLNTDGSINDPLGTLSKTTRERYNEVRDTLQKLEAEFAAVRTAIQGPGPQAGREILPIKTTVQSIEASATAATKSNAVLRDLRQGYADLIAESKRGDITLETFDRRVRELADAFTDKLGKPTKEQAAAFKSLQQSAATARDALATLTVEKATREFERLRNALLPEALRDYNLALQELRRELEDKKLTQGQIDEIVAITEAVSRGQRESDALKNRIGLVLESSITPMAKLNELTQERLALEAQELSLTGKRGPEVDQERLNIAQRKLAIEEASAAVGQQNSNLTAATTEKGNELAAAFDNAASSAFGIATALLGSEASITRAIGGVAQLASSLAKVSSLASDAGGIGALFSSAGGIASALPAIGGLVGGIAAIASQFGGESPAQKAANDLLRRNNERLEALRITLGDALKQSSSGRTLAGVSSALQTSGVATADISSGTRELVATAKGIPNLVAELKKLGLTLADVRQIAGDAGIEISEVPTIRQLQQISRYLKDLDFSAFANSFAGALDRLNAEFDLFPARFKTSADRFAAVIALLNDPEKGAPALFKGLEGIDTSTSAGKDAALAEIQRLFKLLDENKLTAEDLNGLSLEEFFRTLTDLKRELGDLPSDRTATERFAAALKALGTQVEFGTLDATQKLDKLREIFANLFPELAASIDTSSADGFRESLKGIIDGFAADGDLTDAEEAQIEVLRALQAAFDGAATPAQELASALDVLADRFEIFGTSAADQITQLLAEVTGDASAGKNAGFALLKGLTDGLDLATDAGQAELRTRAQAIFDQLSEGGVTAEEQAVIETLKRLLGLASDVANEAAQAAADALAEQERLAEARRKQRQGILDSAENDIKLNDVTDPAEQLRIRVAALAKAFPAFGDVLADFDVSTQEGRDAMEAWIRSIAGSPEDLERLSAAMGISVDELLAALLKLEEGADSAGTHIATLAEKLGAAFDATDFANELEGITDPLEKLKRTSAAVGDVLPEIGDIFKQFSLDTEQGRAGAEAALIALGKSTSDAAVRSAVLKLLAQIRGVPQPNATLGGGSSSTASGGERANVQAAATISEVTGNRMVDLLQRSVAAEEAIRDTIRASLGRTLAVPAPIAPPALPSLLAGGLAGSLGGGGSASGVAVYVTINTEFSGPVTAADSGELSRFVQQRILEVVQGQLATDLLVALRRAGVARSN